jgi:hypothetical protein
VSSTALKTGRSILKLKIPDAIQSPGEHIKWIAGLTTGNPHPANYRGALKILLQVLPLKLLLAPRPSVARWAFCFNLFNFIPIILVYIISSFSIFLFRQKMAHQEHVASCLIVDKHCNHSVYLTMLSAEYYKNMNCQLLILRK